MSTSSHLLHLPFPKPPSLSLPLPSPSASLSLSLSARSCLPIPLSSRLTESAGPVTTNPALNHANILFFQSGYNVQIVVDEGESEEALLRRFRREVSKAGVIQECKRRKFHENKQEEKKRKKQEAGRRNRRRRSGPSFIPSSSQADSDAGKKPRAVDDDNWDLPEGDLPF